MFGQVVSKFLIDGRYEIIEFLLGFLFKSGVFFPDLTFKLLKSLSLAHRNGTRQYDQSNKKPEFFWHDKG
ncbi:MAG: hypothetical protein COZ08_10880 [Bacteroidetes bacterium CG_4_10_14_3_um_filter_42_6]|nr:MAG: hypothetical protein COZ08_10880 [Bacteroidetes bacterium CG_4_10_14_3_um_filter_42_6]